VRRLRRAVRFEEVDAAGIVFFARYLGYCHEGMEDFFSELPGGYAGIVVEQGLGFPAVHTKCDYLGPLRYGDVFDIETTIDRVGTTSVIFRYRLVKDDGTRVCDAEHVCVHARLGALEKIPFSAEMKELFARHMTP
jgi:4-hydroxybenzoyl-CoA thioesterase